MKCNTSGGLRGLCGLVARENVSPFLSNSVSGQEGLFGGRSGGVRVSFFLLGCGG